VKAALLLSSAALIRLAQIGPFPPAAQCGLLAAQRFCTTTRFPSPEPSR
jgi:hypothetical protein